MDRTARTIKSIARAPPESPKRQNGKLFSGVDSADSRKKCG